MGTSNLLCFPLFVLLQMDTLIQEPRAALPLGQEIITTGHLTGDGQVAYPFSSFESKILFLRCPHSSREIAVSGPSTSLLDPIQSLMHPVSTTPLDNRT